MKKSRVVKRIICTILVLAMCLGEMPEISAYAAETNPLKKTYLKAEDVDLSLYTSRTSLMDKLNEVINGKINITPMSDTSSNKDAQANNYALGSIAFDRTKGNVEYKTKNGHVIGWQCYIYAKAIYDVLFGDARSNDELGSNSEKVISSDVSFSYNSIKDIVRNEPGAFFQCEGDWHSFILLKYDTDGVVVLDANYNSIDAKRKACIQYHPWGKFKTIKYVIQPIQKHYDELYPACDHEWAGGVCKKCLAIDSSVVKEDCRYTENQMIRVSVKNSENGYVNSVPADFVFDRKRISNNQLVPVISKVKNGYGNYWYKISYLNAEYYIWDGRTTNTIEQVPSNLTISSDSLYSVEQGKKLSITGMVTSNYPITVKVYLDNNTKNTVAYVTGQKSYSLTDVFNKFDTSNLSASLHKLRVEATDTGGGKKTKDISFIVTTATRVNPPTISPVQEEKDGKYVNITHDSGTVLTYTLNGIKKTTSVSPEKVPYHNEGHCDITAFSSKNGVSSSVKSTSFDVYRVGTPNITYTNNPRGASVTLSSATSGAQIYYSIDDEYSYTPYAGTFQVDSNTTVYAKASRIGYINSAVSNTQVKVVAPSSPIVSVNNSSNHIAVGDNAVVSWSSDGLASYYRVEIYKDGNLVEETEDLYAAQYTMSLNEVGTYSFKVKAVNPFGETYSANNVSVTAHAPSTVSFVNYDGEIITSQEVKYGYDAQKPDVVPVRRGYTFAGWDKSFYSVKSDITVTAQYKINVYKINYYNQNNEFLTSDTVEFGQSINSEKGESQLNLGVGYTFKGWYIKKADEDSERNINFVDSNMELVAVTGWEDKEFPVLVTDMSAKRHLDEYTNVSTGYDVTFKISSIDGQDTKGKVVASAYSADNKMVATSMMAINSISATQEREYTLFLSDNENENVLASIIEVNVLALEGNDRTGGTIAAAVTCQPELEDNNAAWSNWMDQLPENVTTATQSKKVYRSRQNTKDIKTNTTGVTPEGYTLASSSSYWDANWNGPYDYQIGSSATRQVTTQSVVASYKTQYKYYRYVCSNDRSHGWCEVGASCFNWCKLPNGKCSGKIIDDAEMIWLDIPYSSAAGWELATQSGVTRYYTNGSYWYYAPRWYAIHETRDVPASYKTQYYYKDLHSTYNYYKWIKGNWSEWSDTPVTAREDGSFDVETKTVYRYITKDMTTVSESEAYAVSYDNSLVNADAETPATLMVYKSLNTDPTESQLEYVKQITVGELEGFSFKTKEPLSELTGDYVVAIAVKGHDGLINIDTKEAPKPEYTVTFQTEAGDVISEQTIEEGGSATVPEAPEKDGYLFVGWDKATSYVTYNMVVIPKYMPIPYAVVYVDYLNKTCNIETFSGGDLLAVPDSVPSYEGYTFNGWIGAEEGTVVTGNMVVTADWTPNTYSVIFYDADNNILDEQSVEYGQFAELPEYTVEDGLRNFVGWKTDVEWWNVKSDLDVYPIMIYKESASAPESNIPTEYYSDFASIELEAEEGATIYYTLDGSEPGLGYITPAEYDEDGTLLGETFVYEGPIELEESANIRAVAVEAGKNVSEELNINFVYAGKEILYKEPDWNEIATYSVIVEPGKEIVLNVNLEENPGILGYVFSIECDRSVFYIPCDAEGKYIVEMGENFDGKSFCYDYEDKGWQFLWYTTDSSMEAGKMFSVGLMVPEDAEAGTYPIKVSYSPMDLVTEDNIEINENLIGIKLNADDGLVMGDADGDGCITLQDVIKIAKHVAGISPLRKSLQRICDVTGDGAVTIADIVRLARYILGLESLG